MLIIIKNIRLIIYNLYMHMNRRYCAAELRGHPQTGFVHVQLSNAARKISTFFSFSCLTSSLHLPPWGLQRAIRSSQTYWKFSFGHVDSEYCHRKWSTGCRRPAAAGILDGAALAALSRGSAARGSVTRQCLVDPHCKRVQAPNSHQRLLEWRTFELTGWA